MSQKSQPIVKPKDNTPLVSVIMSVYNQAAYAPAAIQSVLTQDYSNLELIVVNDCSQDNSKDVLEKMRSTDARITIINNKINLGQVASLNRAIGEARGKYIANLDGDNVWLGTDKLSTQVEWMEAHPDYVLVGGLVQIIDNEGNKKEIRSMAMSDSEIRNRILITNEFGASCVMYPRELAMKLGGYPRKRRFSRDIGLWLQMGMHGKMINLPHVWHGHRMTGSNIGEIQRKEQLIDALYYIKKHRNDYPNFLKGWMHTVLMIMFFSLPQPLITGLRKIKRLWHE